MDDFGNQLHWTTVAQGWHCQGLYGYAPGHALEVLAQGIDFSELVERTRIPYERI